MEFKEEIQLSNESIDKISEKIMEFLEELKMEHKNSLRIRLLVEEILDLILYPALIYLSFALPVHNRVMNYLGALSFGLYAFQCVPRALRELGLITNVWVIFGIIVALSLAEDLIKRIYKLRKQRGENSDLHTKEDTHASEAS